MSNSSGAIVWEGASEFDGEPIVAIVTGLDGSSSNSKTGPMAQCWVLLRDVHPVRALTERDDTSICGTCPLSGDRGCYVNVPWGVAAVWRAYKAGNYPTAAPHMLMGHGIPVRMTAYGDAAAVPLWVWQHLSFAFVRHTAYTHAWENLSDPGWRHLFMASCDTSAKRDKAQSLGWRTYTTRLTLPMRIGSRARPTRSILCPASIEAGKRTTCAKCLLCNGASHLPSVEIVVHGQNVRLNRQLEIAL